LPSSFVRKDNVLPCFNRGSNILENDEFDDDFVEKYEVSVNNGLKRDTVTWFLGNDEESSGDNVHGLPKCLLVPRSIVKDELNLGGRAAAVIE
jgi:hypothetical protein